MYMPPRFLAFQFFYHRKQEIGLLRRLHWSMTSLSARLDKKGVSLPLIKKNITEWTMDIYLNDGHLFGTTILVFDVPDAQDKRK